MAALTMKETPDPPALQQKRSSNSKFVAVPTSSTKRATIRTATTSTIGFKPKSQSLGTPQAVPQPKAVRH